MDPGPLAPTAVVELLWAASTIIRAELSALPPAALGWHPAPGEWCAKEVLGHLIESERRGFAGRIRIILASDGLASDGLASDGLASDRPQLEGWDQEVVARERKDCDRDWSALCDEFTGLRADSAALVAGLRPSDLGRAGQHPKVGVLTVADLLHEWVHHDRNHIRQMLANVQASVWPRMGAAQRFSAT
jgi:hypothetical protein